MLSERHYSELSVGSGISDAVIKAIGYETVTEKSELARRGFGDKQRLVPALLIPLHRPGASSVSGWQTKADNPRMKTNGKVRKYEFPFGKPPVLDCPPVELMTDALNTKRADLWLTEGSKKAASAVSNEIPCLSLGGVWNWRGKNEFGVKTTISDINEIDWEERPVHLCFDNDVMFKEGVYWALVRLAGILQSRGADVYFAVLPPGDAKGLDDWLVAGGTRGFLRHLSTKRVPGAPQQGYTYNDAGMARRVADHFEDELVFDNWNESWFVWNEIHWVKDKTANAARRYILDYTDVIRDEAKLLSEDKEEGQPKSPKAQHLALAKSYGNFSPIRGAEQVMRSLLMEHKTGFNSKPDLLNCPNGTLNLKTGEFRGHRPDDRLTTLTGARWPTTPEEEHCPLWEGFMSERFPNPETRAFIQRMCGLFVTGNSPEKAFFILRGEKDCGKTVFIEFLHWLLGDYANKVDKSTLTKTRGGDTKARRKP